MNRRQNVFAIAIYATLILGAVVFSFPFLWMISTSLKLDRELFRFLGIEPEAMKVLVNKSSVHFRADFAPIASRILIAKAPGPMAADPSDLPWTRLPATMALRP